MYIIIFFALWSVLGALAIGAYPNNSCPIHDTGFIQYLSTKNWKQVLFIMFIHGPIMWAIGIISLICTSIVWLCQIIVKLLD